MSVTSTDTAKGWLVCDKGICLYEEGPTVRERCIKHGAILNYEHALTGCKTRAEAKDKLTKMDERAELLESRRPW